MDDAVGRILREARIERGLDLADVAAVTKVREGYLRAIEAEEWDRLPGETYARGFIRAYASHLGLDGEELAERQRRSRGARLPAEEVPRVEPQPITLATGRRRGTSRAPRLALAAVGAAAAGALVVLLILWGGGGSGSPTLVGTGRQAGAGAPSAAAGGQPTAPAQPGHTVSLTATAEVWVCLLGARGRPLIDGEVLGPGASEGPYRSGNFTLSLGNGEVTMKVDGEQASIPATPSPVGYSIEGGTMRRLSESERPTCT